MAKPPLKPMNDVARSIRPKRLLYIQHTGIAYSGSAKSLLYTLAALDRDRYQPIVAVIRPCQDLLDLYRGIGVETLSWPGVGTFEHTTAHSCSPVHPLCWQHQIQMAKGWSTSKKRVAALVAEVKPDLVHLNSVVLVQAALALEELGMPFVWHVRESPSEGLLGFRRQWMVNTLKRAPKQSIFISEADRRAWVGGGIGKVVFNFVDVTEFENAMDTGPEVRSELGIADGAPVVAYLGGIGEVKGYLVLLEALSILRKRFQGLRCIMPGTIYPPPSNWKSAIARKTLPIVGGGTLGQKAEALIRRFSLEDVCLRMPGMPSVAGFLAASDVVAFPSLTPHFARPVIEGAVMGVPAVSSDLDGPRELIDNGHSGVLVRPNDAAALAEGLAELLENDEKRHQMGANAREAASERFDARQGIRQIESIYDVVFGKMEQPAERSGKAELR
jgi:glycosyltransferase involved in cell wall biosynthesis